jgi:uncharacterized protein with GYD domain
MPHYLVQIAYTPESWAAQIKNPQNRIEAVRPAVESLGGKIEGAWYSFGDYDVALVMQAPDNVAATALALAFAAGGALKAVKTTPLMTIEEGIEALKKAGRTGYKPAG